MKYCITALGTKLTNGSVVRWPDGRFSLISLRRRFELKRRTHGRGSDAEGDNYVLAWKDGLPCVKWALRRVTGRWSAGMRKTKLSGARKEADVEMLALPSHGAVKCSDTPWPAFGFEGKVHCGKRCGQ